MKKLFFSLACIVAIAACQKNVPSWKPVEPTEVKSAVKITPVITKVTSTQFEAGDAIGVNITRANDVVYAANTKLTYDGSVFSGSLMWYAEGTEGATVAAYYPYAETVPTSFTVQADQSAGTSASDFVAGGKSGVLPSAHAVVIPFQHKLTKIVLNVTNNAEGEPVAIKLKGAKPTATIAADFTATVDETVAAGTIISHKVSSTVYELILPAQTVALTATVETAGGNELSQTLQETALLAGKVYTISMIVNPADLKVAFSDEIQDWEEGGELGSDNTLIEKLSAGYIMYHEQKYNVAKMDDGKWWMTQNLRYVPDGTTVADDLTSVTAGVFYPLVVNAGQTAAEFSKNIEVITAKGYLYQVEFAMGKTVGSIATVEEAQALNGAQGLCPKGWHIPTIDDIVGLVGKAITPIETVTTAPYYNGSNGSIALLNADGFNIEAYGAVSIVDNTKTTGTFMGWMKAYPDKLSTSMMIGSTYAGVTYNTSGDATSGIKNLQFYGLVPMTNKASEADYTCNGTKVSFRVAGPLRCVRNSD